MTTDIISVQNPKVKQWSALLTRRGRDEQNRFLLEGVHLVQEALHNGIAVTTVLYALDKGLPAELSQSLAPQVELIGVSPTVLAKCSDTGTPQGVIAVAGKPDLAFRDVMARERTLIVAVDGVQDPGNLGTIIRSADAAGATGVLLGKGTVDLYNPKTVRATMGSLFHLPVLECDLPAVLPELQGLGTRIYSTSLSADSHCYAADLTVPVCFVVGNEGSGVSPQVDRLVTDRVKIPMPGKAESLNVAMATTVLLFEAMRQRGYSLN